MPTFRDELHTGHKVPLVETDDLMNRSVTEEKMADDSVSTRTIVNESITEAKMHDDSVSTRTIIDGNVTEEKMHDNSVSTRTIIARNVTEEKLADNSVSTRTIIDRNVTEGKLADDSVSTRTIVNRNVTEEKMHDDSVSTRTIIAKNVTNPKLADEAVDDRTLAEKVHRKMEKLEVSISKTNATNLEIGGSEPLTLVLSGSAKVVTFGDDADVPVTSEQMTVKKFSVNNVDVAEDTTSTSYNIPVSGDASVGAYQGKFTCAFNGTTKSASVTTNLNLRKYAGYADSEPTDPTILSNSDFSNSVGWTLTLPALNDGLKYIYFAVPDNMAIQKIIQTSTNYQMALAGQPFPKTITRTIDGVDYTYKLYRSLDENSTDYYSITLVIS